MDLVNAIIQLDVERLNFKLRPWKAKQGNAFVARLSRVPDDVTGLFVRIFKADGSSYDVSGNEHRDGTWTVRVPGACFPTVGEFKYEVHAKTCDDEPCALGAGIIDVMTYSVGSAPSAGTANMIATIPTTEGGEVRLMMTYNGTKWSLVASIVEEG